MAALVALVVSGTVTPATALAAPGTTERLTGGDLSARAETTSGPARCATWPRRSTGCRSGPSNSSTSSGRSPGDASHQLRTPLTALRLRLEQATDLLETDPQGARERLEAASAETERLQHVIGGLLAFAHADGRGDPAEPVDVVAVAQRARRDVEAARRGGGRPGARRGPCLVRSRRWSCPARSSRSSTTSSTTRWPSLRRARRSSWRCGAVEHAVDRLSRRPWPRHDGRADHPVVRPLLAGRRRRSPRAPGSAWRWSSTSPGPAVATSAWPAASVVGWWRRCASPSSREPTASGQPVMAATISSKASSA